MEKRFSLGTLLAIVAVSAVSCAAFLYSSVLGFVTCGTGLFLLLEAKRHSYLSTIERGLLSWTLTTFAAGGFGLALLTSRDNSKLNLHPVMYPLVWMVLVGFLFAGVLLLYMILKFVFLALLRIHSKKQANRNGTSL